MKPERDRIIYERGVTPPSVQSSVDPLVVREGRGQVPDLRAPPPSEPRCDSVPMETGGNPRTHPITPSQSVRAEIPGQKAGPDQLLSPPTQGKLTVNVRLSHFQLIFVCFSSFGNGGDDGDFSGALPK